MKTKESQAFWGVSGLIIFNLVVFISISGFFLNQIHHHWILPTASALMVVELALTETVTPRLLPRSTPLFRKTLLITLLVFCLVGAARHYTIFTCIENCGLKLGLMYEIAAGIFAFSAFRFQKEGNRNWARWTGGAAAIFLVLSGLCFFTVMHWGRN